MITLHGLKIDDRPGDDSELAAGADLRWVRRSAEIIGSDTESSALLETRADGAWTRQIFADGESVKARFSISPDGSLVQSVAVPGVPEAALLELLSETVMRSVFRHRGIVSFHAAALSRDGRGILLMGDRGAGKSTLSMALVQTGWTLMADDLVRVVSAESAWSFPAGLRQSKITEETAVALGLDLAQLPRRWTAMGQTEISNSVNKLIYKHPDADSADVSLTSIYVLAPRRSDTASPLVENLSAAERLTVLLRNLTRDGACPAAPISAAENTTALRIVGAVPVRLLTMPDELDSLMPIAANQLFAL